MNMNSEELDPGLDCDGRTDFQDYPCVGRCVIKLLEVRVKVRKLARTYCRCADVHRTAFLQVS